MADMRKKNDSQEIKEVRKKNNSLRMTEMLKKNDSFETEITDISDEGAGIGRTAGLVWFIKDALPGDFVEAAVTKLKKNYGFARLIRVLRPSLDRTDARCSIARQCGGCQLQAMTYEAQLRFKQKKVLNNLRRIGGFYISEETEAAGQTDVPGQTDAIERNDADGQMDAIERNDVNGQAGTAVTEPIIGADEPFRYRNKAQFPIGRSRDGRIIAGFYAGRTHSIIECGDCLLGCEENKPILDCIIRWMEEQKLEPYDEANGRGLVRHVLIRKAYDTGEMMVCIVINADRLPYAEELVHSLLQADVGTGARIASISYNINMKNTNVIMGTELVNLYGPGYIEDSIRYLPQKQRQPHSAEQNEGGAGNRGDMSRENEVQKINGNALQNPGQPVRFHISPLSFYQVNPRQMERLYSTALDYAGLTGTETVWDLYCGIGTISLFLAQRAKKVYGVEIIPQAIENARENARLNAINNAEFFVGKAEEVLPAWYAEQEKAVLRGQGSAAQEDSSLQKKNGSSAKENSSAAEESGSGLADVIVVDPPRKGCDEKCLETIVKIAPKRVVYVSCDSATLARDLRYLCANGYVLKKVRVHDMFPNTVHVETIVLLSHKSFVEREGRSNNGCT